MEVCTNIWYIYTKIKGREGFITTTGVRFPSISKRVNFNLLALHLVKGSSSIFIQPVQLSSAAIAKALLESLFNARFSPHLYTQPLIQLSMSSNPLYTIVPHLARAKIETEKREQQQQERGENEYRTNKFLRSKKKILKIKKNKMKQNREYIQKFKLNITSFSSSRHSSFSDNDYNFFGAEDPGVSYPIPSGFSLCSQLFVCCVCDSFIFI